MSSDGLITYLSAGNCGWSYGAGLGLYWGEALLAKALWTVALSPPLSALQVSQGRFIFALVFILGVFSGATLALFGRR